MSYIKKRRAMLVVVLVLSIVLSSISLVSAASRTEDVYNQYDASVKSGSSAYGYTDGNRWTAVYEKVLGTNGTPLTPIWYSPDGTNYYPVEVSREYRSGYIYTFKANGEVLYQGPSAVIDPAIITKLYDKKLTKTIYSGTETVSNTTFDGPVEVEAGANITFDNVKFNNGLTTYGISNVSNSTFTDSTATNKGDGVTYITDSYFGHTSSSSSYMGSTTSVVGVKIKSNRLTDAIKGKPYEEVLTFPDFSYTYYPGSFSPMVVTSKMHYDSINIVGTLPNGLVSSAANYDAANEKTDVNISGTTTAEGIDQKFYVNFKEGVSKLDITVPMLITVNSYSLEYKVIGETPSGYTVPNAVAGIGYSETIALEAAPNRIEAEKNGVNGVWEFTGWSTDKDNLDATKVRTVDVTQNTEVYGQWKFTPKSNSSNVNPNSNGSSPSNQVNKKDIKKTPNTGDGNNFGGYLLMLGATSAALVVVGRRRFN